MTRPLYVFHFTYTTDQTRTVIHGFGVADSRSLRLRRKQGGTERVEWDSGVETSISRELRRSRLPYTGWAHHIPQQLAYLASQNHHEVGLVVHCMDALSWTCKVLYG